MFLPKAWKYRLPRRLISVPLPRVVERRDGDGFTAIETNQRSVNQLSHFHYHGKRVDVDAGTLPDLGAGRGGQHRLDIDALGAELEAEPLGQERHESLGRAVHRHAELRRESDH